MRSEGPSLSARALRICFVVHEAYGEMAGGRTGHVGGAERLATLLCRGLAARGHRVSLLTWDEGQADEVEIEGVRVIKLCRQDAGVPGIRFFHPRWSSLNRGMRRANADLYYQACADYVTGQVALWCRYHHRRLVYSVVSDVDCHPRLPGLRTIRERVLYRYGVRRADCVIAQTRRQQEMLAEAFGVRSVVMPVPGPGAAAAAYRAPEPPSGARRRVLWLGRIAPEKRLELLLDLAEALPDVAFDVAGPLGGAEQYSRLLLARAATLPNVTMLGRVVRERLPELFGQATLLCCTSLYEGFPNTFLEAWSHGLPVLSTVDPDGLVQSRGLGLVAADKAGLVRGLQTLLESPNRWRELSTNAREYYVQYHTVEAVIPQMERLFLDLLDGRLTVDWRVDEGGAMAAASPGPR